MIKPGQIKRSEDILTYIYMWDTGLQPFGLHFSISLMLLIMFHAKHRNAPIIIIIKVESR